MQDARWTTDAGSGTRQARTQGCLCLSLALAGTFAAATAMAAEPAETVVRLHPTAVVNAEQVLLSDIASLSGTGAELADTWPVTVAPTAGGETTVDQASIQHALIRRGINPATWIFRGAAQCRITRPAAIRGAEPAAAGPAARTSRLRTKPSTTAPAVESPDHLPAGPAPDTLEGVIYAHMAARLESLGGKPVVQMSPAIRDLLQLSRPAYEFAIADKSDRLLGLVPFDVTIYRNGNAEQTRSILAEVSLTKAVVVAAGTINRGQTIAPEHMTLKPQTFDRLEKVGSGDVKAFVGQRALRFINRDEPVSTKDVEPLPLIARNDLVTVTIRRGDVTIKGVAKAMAAATYGQAVELRNESSKQTFLATVTGPKTAELSDGGQAIETLSMAGGGN